MINTEAIDAEVIDDQHREAITCVDPEGGGSMIDAEVIDD